MHQCAHHDSSPEMTPEKRLAVLRYMLDHNEHHAEELHEIGHQLDGEASALIHDAVDLFVASNEKLALALEALEAGK